MSESKHTPLPWVVEYATDKRGADIIRTAGPVVEGATKGVEIAKITNRIRGPLGDYRANADLIIRAVNCHADLVAALEWVAQQAYAGGKGYGDVEPVKSALAKAKQ